MEAIVTDMSSETKVPRKVYFSFHERIKQFDTALTSLIDNLVRSERAKILNPENVMRYYHGTSWVSVASSDPHKEEEMKIHSTEAIINMKDIREHKLSALHYFIMDIVKKMHDETQKVMYQTVADTCENSGQTVNAKDYASPADAYLETLKTLEFGIDREGKVSYPEFHMGSPQAWEALKKDIEAKGVSFQAEVNKVTKEKEEAALEREKKRIARFKT